MALFEFYIDGNRLANDPIDWDKSKKKLKRSDKYNAVFIEYVVDLIFIGDGYLYLKNLFDSAPCSEVTIQIFERASDTESSELYFEGVIKLIDAEVDLEKAQIKCNADDATLTGRFLNLIDTEVQHGATKSINGQTNISLTAKNCRINKNYDTITYSQVYGYKVSDLFTHIIDHNTDSTLTFASDFFETDTSTRNLQILRFTGGLANGGVAGNIVITFKNPFNQEITYTIPKQAAAIDTLNAIKVYLGYRPGGFQFQGRSAYYFKDHRTWENLQIVGGAPTIYGFDLYLYSDLPFSLVSITGASYDASVWEDNLYPDKGKRDLIYTYGNRLRGGTNMGSMSFSRLFNELNKIFGLAFAITIESGVKTLRVEPISYFLQNSASITIRGVSNVKYQYSNTFAKSFVSVGDGSRNVDEFYNHEHSKDTWLTGANCDNDKLDLAGSFVTDTDWIYQYIAGTYAFTQDDDERGVLIECEPYTSGGYNYQSINYYGEAYYTQAFPLPSADTYNVINQQMTNYQRIINNGDFINGDITYSDKTITNPSLNSLRYEYDFEYPLTREQMKTIVENRDKYIVFNETNDIGNDKRGYIVDVEMEQLTGMAKLKVITKTNAYVNAGTGKG